MKKMILTIAATLFLTGMAVNSFGQEQDKKVKAEKKEVAKANKDLKEAKKDSVEDYKKFKIESEEKIRDNEKKIADLKTKKLEGTKEANETYNKKVAALEQRNMEMKNRMNNYKGDGNDKWQSFKREFNHDMKELGNAVKDLGKNNVK